MDQICHFNRPGQFSPALWEKTSSLPKMMRRGKLKAGLSHTMSLCLKNQYFPLSFDGAFVA